MKPKPSSFFKKLISLILWYIPVLCVQFLAAGVTVTKIQPWYETLKKAPWTPPAWVFGPAWTLLYLSMAVAIWLVALAPAKRSEKIVPFILFFIQLAVNGLWSFLFFGYQLVGWALIDLALLVVLIAWVMRSFFQVRPVAAVILIPYFLWSVYALSLNAAIWWLN